MLCFAENFMQSYSQLSKTTVQDLKFANSKQCLKIIYIYILHIYIIYIYIYISVISRLRIKDSAEKPSTVFFCHTLIFFYLQIEMISTESIFSDNFSFINSLLPRGNFDVLVCWAAANYYIQMQNRGMENGEWYAGMETRGMV